MEAKGRILIIESDGTDHFAFRALSHSGWGVHAAHDDADGIKVFEILDPDLLLLELNPYSLNRVCYWDQVRQTLCRGWRRRPLVVLTSSQSFSDEVAALDDGADDFLCKPISETLLMARIRRLLRPSGASV